MGRVCVWWVENSTIPHNNLNSTQCPDLWWDEPSLLLPLPWGDVFDGCGEREQQLVTWRPLGLFMLSVTSCAWANPEVEWGLNKLETLQKCILIGSVPSKSREVHPITNLQSNLSLFSSDPWLVLTVMCTHEGKVLLLQEGKERWIILMGQRSLWTLLISFP